MRKTFIDQKVWDRARWTPRQVELLNHEGIFRAPDPTPSPFDKLEEKIKSIQTREEEE